MEFMGFVLIVVLSIFIIKVCFEILINRIEGHENKKNKYLLKDKSDNLRGWKVMPYIGKKISEFDNRNELELYRLYTLIKDVVSSKNGVIKKIDGYYSFYIIFEEFKLQVKLEALNNMIKYKVSEKEIKIKKKNKEDHICSFLKKELLNYTYMLEEQYSKVGKSTLIARVKYCDIKVDIQKSA